MGTEEETSTGRGNGLRYESKSIITANLRVANYKAASQPEEPWMSDDRSSSGTNRSERLSTAGKNPAVSLETPFSPPGLNGS